MSDAADDADKSIAEVIDRALANRPKPTLKISPIDCADCGEPIEKVRRDYFAGTEHCAECAKYNADVERFKSGKFYA